MSLALPVCKFFLIKPNLCMSLKTIDAFHTEMTQLEVLTSCWEVEALLTAPPCHSVLIKYLSNELWCFKGLKVYELNWQLMCFFNMCIQNAAIALNYYMYFLLKIINGCVVVYSCVKKGSKGSASILHVFLSQWSLKWYGMASHSSPLTRTFPHVGRQGWYSNHQPFDH